MHTTAVTVREDTPGNKQLTAYTVPTPGHAPTAGELRTHLQQQLPDYMIPSLYIPLDHLPLTPNGKVDTKALPAPTTTDPTSPPPTPHPGRTSSAPLPRSGPRSSASTPSASTTTSSNSAGIRSSASR
ncbi:hypothetical protein L1856_05165 [Streptomyces sp. Tue 6430]|nr:hypothetical protein [Streptomyces sp. Tue 6430]